MTKKKQLAFFATALVACGAVHAATVCSGSSASVAIDSRTGVRTLTGGPEVLVYDASWYEGGATVRIDGMGTTPLTGTAGMAEWTPFLCLHHLTLEVFNVSGTLVGSESVDFSLGYIRNVTAQQVWPHKKVEVCFDVAEDIGDEVDAGQALSLSAQFGSSTATAQHVLGDMTCSPGPHRVVWDMEADGLSVDSSSATFRAGVGTPPNLHGLSVKYYDISSSGYSTWTQSEAAMTNYFTGRTPTIVTNTLDWGETLQSGFQGDVSGYFQDYPGLWLDNVSTNRYHGKYANKSQDHFAMFFEGELVTSEEGTYRFAVSCDNAMVLYIDGTLVCSFQWPTSNGQPRSATNSLTLSPGKHRISIATYESDGLQGMFVSWKHPGDTVWSPLPQSALSNGEVDSNTFELGGTVSGIPVNTSSSVQNGMNVSGAMELACSPFANGEATLVIDGTTLLSSTNSGTFAWQPQTMGTHTLKHVSGNTTWTRTVNVTSIAGAVPPAPNPPTVEDPNISLSTTSKSFDIAGGSGSIATRGSGTWTATASDDWITIPASLASRNAGLPVPYQVAANTEVEDRTGYIYVSGHVFTVTQSGVGASLSATSASFEADGGSGFFTVLADPQASWQTRSNADWISIASTSGTGEADVSYTVAPFHEVSTRSGTITVAGCTFTVHQTGRRMKIYVPDGGGSGVIPVERDYLSHSIDVQVNALSSTIWDVEPNASWISVVDGGSGHGGDNVMLGINTNVSWLARTGTVRIGTETLTIRQMGRPSSALSFDISPTASTASVRGANGVISVLATPDLPWTAQSQANWLTVKAAYQTGAGNGNVVYTASPNPTMANRTGTISVQCADGNIANPTLTHTVTQPAATAMVSASAHTFAAQGESFGVDVTVDDVVNWMVSENSDWISISGGTSRIGPGTVTIMADPNLTVNPRSETVTIAGHSFAVSQKGRTVEVEYESRVFGSETDYDTIDVHPDGNVEWMAVSSDQTWISIWGDDDCDYDLDGNVIGTGDHTIEYIVADYVGDGTPRTGWITIGDKTVYITQRAYDLSINPSATSVSGNAGAGTVGVPATADQIWNAIATEPWITIVSGYDSGTGSGIVHFTYEDNDTGEERTGKILISGEAYTITQAARQLVSITARVEGGRGIVSGTGTYDLGTNVTLTVTAQDGYEFVSWGLPNGSTATGSSISVTADVDKEIVATFRRIPVYDVNGESVREGTSKTFTAPADVMDAAGTTKLVCRGTSRYPDKGTSFTLVVTEDIAFEWDLWTTNYLVTVEQSAGGTIKKGNSQAPATMWLQSGFTLNLTAAPDSGKSLFRWCVTETIPNPVNPANPANPVGNTSTSLRLCVEFPLTISAVFGVFNDTLASALDAPSLAFTTGGDANWTPVIDATAQTGYTSARSGAAGADTDTWLDLTLEGAGTLSFRWRVDCEKDDGGEATWDRLAVFVNGVEAARIDGRTDWETVTLPISDSKTTIRWSFYRDDYDEPDQTHENAGWVDGVIWSPN